MVIHSPSIKVGEDTSLTVGCFAGSSELGFVGSVQFLIGIIAISEELGVLSLPYPDMKHIESITIIAYGDDRFVTALLSPGKVSIEPDPLDLGWFRQSSIFCKPVSLSSQKVWSRRKICLGAAGQRMRDIESAGNPPDPSDLGAVVFL